MSFVQSLFAPKVKATKQDYRFADQTSKLVGKPLPVIYGRALVRGNVVYASSDAALTKADHIVALCWGPIYFHEATIKVNGKRPKAINEQVVTANDQIGIKVYIRDGHGGQVPLAFTGDTAATYGDPGTWSAPGYGLNRTAFARVRGKASSTYGGFDQFECVVERPNLFVNDLPTGYSSQYHTPIPAAIAAAFPAGLPSANPIAAALDYLLNAEYGAGKSPAMFGDCATWIAAINYSQQAVTIPGGTEPRHWIGIAVGGEEADSHNDVVDLLLELGDAKSFNSGGYIKVWQPRAGLSPVAALTRADFDPRGAQYDDIIEKPNVIDLNYDEGLSTTDKKSVTWLDQISMAEYGEIRKSYSYRGIASRTMASRKARLIGRRAIAESLQIEGAAHHRYRLLEPGDLVAVTVGDESGEWLAGQAFWVDNVERVTSDTEYGVNLTLVQYGGDALYDDGMASELDTNDPILETPRTGLPDPRGEPLPVIDVTGEVSQFSDQDGRVSYVGTLMWPEPQGEPQYMHDRYNIYRRSNLSSQWQAIGSTGSPVFRDVGTPVYAGDVYYAVVSVTSSQNEGALPSLFSVKLDRITGPVPVDPQNITVTAGNQILASSGLVYYLDVSWIAVPGAVRYQVYYRLNGGANIFVQELTGTSLRIDQVVPGSYLISVVAIGGNGQTSQISSTTFVLTDEAYDGPEQPLNLRLGGYDSSTPGRFNGRNIDILWDAPASATYSNPRFKDYVVEVIQGILTVDVVYVLEPKFTYDYERNWRNNRATTGKDHASREVTFKVRTRDRADRLSGPVQMTASNPQVGVPEVVEVNVAFKLALVEVTPAVGVPDLAGCIFAMGSSSSFVPTADTYVAEAASQRVLAASITVVPGTTTWVKVALYDVFGKDSLNWSSAYQVQAQKLVSQEIADAAIRSNNIADEVFDGIEGRVGNNGVLVVSSLPSIPDLPDPITGNRKYFKGRLVFLIGDGKLYRNVNEVWTRTVDGADILFNSITAGALTAGVISADKLAANAITARALAIGDFSNICADPIFTDAGYWYVDTSSGGTASFVQYTSMLSGCPASNGLRLSMGTNNQYLHTYMRHFDVEPGEKYYLSCYGGNNSVLRTMYITTIFLDRAGTYISTAPADGSAVINPGANLYGRMEAVVVVPAGCYRMRPHVTVSIGTAGGICYFTLFRCRKMTGTVLLENGAVTADKVIAGAINTDKLAAAAVVAEKIAAGAITADKIAANAITAINISADSITTDKLTVNGVTTTKVAGGAISNIVAAGVAGYNANTSSETLENTRDILTYTTDANGAGVVILHLSSYATNVIDYLAQVTASTYGNTRAKVAIMRARAGFADVLIWGDNLLAKSGEAVSAQIPRSMTLIDVVGASVTVTYRIYFYAYSDSSTLRQHSVDIKSFLITLQELKR